MLIHNGNRALIGRSLQYSPNKCTITYKIKINLLDKNNLFIPYFMLTVTIKSIKQSDLYNSLHINSCTNGI